MRVRRTAFLFIRFQSFPFVDIELLLRGTVKVTSTEQIAAVSIPAGREYPISWAELEALAKVPFGRAVSAEEAGADDELVLGLASKGLLIAEDAGGELAVLRNREERLTREQWHPTAAMFHFLTRWRDEDVGVPSELLSPEGLEPARRALREFVERSGPPPPPFKATEGALERTELPLPPRDRGPLFETLSRRRTSRGLDNRRPLPLDALSTLLSSVFGCHGRARVLEDLVILRKTSPSGGGLHPIEAYPLILNAEGVEAGLYHYEPGTHSLALLRGLSAPGAADLAETLAAGQSFARGAQALFLMTARFYRSYWKYRGHPRAYSVLLMDAAHLSQTFYLVCAELGLGAFVTAAVNGIRIEEELGLDGFEEGALVLCGCGDAPEGSNLDPAFEPYVPRESAV